MADRAIRIEVLDSLDALPIGALALFGSDAFSTPGWYRSVTEAALPPGSQACFHLAWCGADLLGVLPMRRSGVGFSALTTPYTVLWSPLLRAGLDDNDLVGMGRALGRVWRRGALTRLDALDAQARFLEPLLRGLRRAGLVPLRFEHFANWYLPVAGLGWDAYRAGRPGTLRSAIKRRSGRLIDGMGAVFTLMQGTDGVDDAIAAYEHVYSTSWKEPEPFPSFNPALMRASAMAGSLRLGVLRLGGVPIAAQFWLLHGGPGDQGGGWAGVQKLAHDDAYRKLAPGTVLTALMVRHLLEIDRVSELDFGRGDDEYKQSWTGCRRPRIGVVLANPLLPDGAVAVARHYAGALRRAMLRRAGRPVHLPR